MTIEPKLINAGSSGEWGWHATELAMRCPQLFAYHHRIKKEAVMGGNREPLLKGSLVHQGLAHYYARLKNINEELDPDLWATTDAAIDACAEELGSEALKFVDLAKRTIVAYASHYATETLAPMHIEEVFSGEVGGFKFTQRFDLVARNSAGKVVIVDHKCLPAGAEVFTREGPMSVGELFARGATWGAVAWESGDRLVWAQARAPVDAGVQDVWVLKTAAGLSGRFGYRHPILTLRGWVRACDLRPGDRVAAANHLPELPDAPVSDSVLWVAGSLICDGGMKASGPHYTKASVEKQRKFVGALMNEKQAPETDFAARSPEGKTPYVKLFADSFIARRLKELGLIGYGFAEKRIPRSLMALSRRQVGVLIAALWSGDGHAGVRKSGTARLVYASRSRGLCLDVKALLARLGIASTVTDSSVKYKGSRRGYYFTTIVGNDAKLAFLRSIANGTIPTVGIDVEPIIAACERAGAHKLSRHFPVSNDVMWDTIESCLFVGKERCYDIEVPECHTFVAEGLVTHNTTGRLSPDSARRYTLSGQFLGMQTFGRAVWGSDFGGVTINLIEVPKWGGEFKFARVEADPAPAALKGFPLTVLTARQRIADLDAAGTDPWNWPKALSEQICVTPYGFCGGFELCRWGKP